MWEAFTADAGLRDVYIATIACLLTDTQASAGEKLDFNNYATRMAVAEKIFNCIYREYGSWNTGGVP
jgi:hypothetical protein